MTVDELLHAGPSATPHPAAPCALGAALTGALTAALVLAVAGAISWALRRTECHG